MRFLFSFLIPGACFLVADPSDHARWVAGYYGIWGDILRDKAIGTYYRILADGDVAKDRCSGADGGPFFHQGRLYPLVGFGLEISIAISSSWVFVVDEGHMVADKNVVVYRDSLANEGVAGNLAIFPDASILLNLYEGSEFGIVSDATPVEVDKLR